MNDMSIARLIASVISHNIWISRFIPDKLYLKIMYRGYVGKRLDLENPETFNEKLQWLKLNDRRPEYKKMVDKIDVKEYASDVIGKQYIIPTLGVWNEFDEINFDMLPNQFVLKCSNDSGGIVICKEKKKLNMELVKKKIKKDSSYDFFYKAREWPYLGIKPRILAEQYISDGSLNGIQDYKIHCFNGEPKLILVCGDRFSQTGLTEDFFDTQWNHLDIKRPNHGNSMKEIRSPAKLEEMLVLARQLSKNIPFVRIDFYEVENKVLFGEITFFPQCGFGKFIPEKWDSILGKWLELPK